MAKAIPNPGATQKAAGKPIVDPNDSTAGDVRLWENEGNGSTDNSAPDDQSLLAALEADSREGLIDPGMVDALQAENAELRRQFEELRAQREADSKLHEQWRDLQEEYEARLEEKTEVIRTLHVKVEELEVATLPVKRTPKDEELLAMSEDLERERCQLQQEQRELEELRKRLTEDERAMHEQMREMEMQMARERAEFARRRTDMQRILEEIRREIDKAERNGQLNQRLRQIRDQYSQNANKEEEPEPAANEAPAPITPALPETKKPGDSTLLRRLFKR
jgi:chromosome segregation ATPase